MSGAGGGGLRPKSTDVVRSRREEDPPVVREEELAPEAEVVRGEEEIAEPSRGEDAARDDETALIIDPCTVPERGDPLLRGVPASEPVVMIDPRRGGLAGGPFERSETREGDCASGEPGGVTTLGDLLSRGEIVTGGEGVRTGIAMNREPLPRGESRGESRGGDAGGVI
jgi:hypothetical protein